MSVLQAVDVSCVRRDRVLFEDLSVTLNPGDLIYLTGQNGAGKTSLLRMLIGFVEPASGSILWNDVSLDDTDARRDMNAHLVYIGHKSGIDAQASAIENSRFWCEQQGLSVSDATIYETLGLLGLVGLEDIPCAQLSAGQNRRVALARLWFKTEATVWILDEPFTALDVQGIELLETYIQAFVSRGGSVLMTSHQALSHITHWRSLALEYRIQ